MSPTGAAATSQDAGIEAYRRGDLESAERHFADAARLAPGEAQVRNGLGIVVAARGRVEEALDHFRAALAIDPLAIAAATNLADAALNLGRLDEARTTLDAALATAPRDVGLHALQCETLAAQGLAREALPVAARWAALAPGEAQAHRAHGTIGLRVGDYGAALAAFRRARTLDAASTDERLDVQGIAACLEYARFVAPDHDAERELVECLHAPGVESQTLARAAADLVRVCHGVDGGDPPVDLDGWAARGWTRSALLRALLERAINVDARLERILVAQRRALANAYVGSGVIPARWRRLAGAMATQCFLNEHAWPIDAIESACTTTWRERLESTPIEVWREPEMDLLTLVALYSPLATLDTAPALAATSAPDVLGPLVERALREPLAEREIARALPRATISDAISGAVRAQYEESPYPRWVDLPEPNPEPLTQQLTDQFPAFRMTPTLEGSLRILIAGCGSGRHPLRVALGDPGAEVVAIDLSIASLAYAERRARGLGIANVEFRQHDILDAAELDGTFAVIESSGVLHHMREPAAGLAALVAKLRPGGVLKLGLYSRRAREMVTRARARIADLGIEATPEAIRRFRAALLAGQTEGLGELADSSDLYALSACRDLLFHVQEHQFSPPEIGALLAAENLAFLGFQLPSFAVGEAYRAAFPGDPDRNDLACWDRFEADNPHTFANTFQLWCQKPE